MSLIAYKCSFLVTSNLISKKSQKSRFSLVFVPLYHWSCGGFLPNLTKQRIFHENEDACTRKK